MPTATTEAVTPIDPGAGIETGPEAASGENGAGGRIGIGAATANLATLKAPPTNAIGIAAKVDAAKFTVHTLAWNYATLVAECQAK